MPINNKPPWVVNEAGQELGLSHIDEATHNLAKVFMAWMAKQYGSSIRPPTGGRPAPTTADRERTDLGRQGVPKTSRGPKRRLNTRQGF